MWKGCGTCEHFIKNEKYKRFDKDRNWAGDGKCNLTNKILVVGYVCNNWKKVEE